MPKLIRTASITLAIVVLLGLVVVRPAARVQADDGWCWDDPTLVLNGQTFHIDAGVPQAQRDGVTAVSITIMAPANVRAHLSGGTPDTLPTTVNLIRSPRRGGSTPAEVTITGVVTGRSGTQVGMRVWRQNASTGILAQTAGTTGHAMTLTVDAPAGPAGSGR